MMRWVCSVSAQRRRASASSKGSEGVEAAVDQRLVGEVRHADLAEGHPGVGLPLDSCTRHLVAESRYSTPSTLEFPAALPLLIPILSDSLQQNARRLIVRILRDQLAAEGPRKNGLILRRHLRLACLCSLLDSVGRSE